MLANFNDVPNIPFGSFVVFFQEDTDFCPVAAIWRRWNLIGHEPIFNANKIVI